MILNRLAKALKNQNWSIVFTEFVIVVAGIYVGLQVNEWAAERENRVQEKAAVERLFLESKNAHQLLEQYLQSSLRINEIRRNAVQFADSQAPIPENDLRLRIGINTLAQFPAIAPISVTYDELKSSGQMQLIQSAALRDQIAGFYNDVIQYNQLRSDFKDSTDPFWEGYQRHVTWDYNPEATTSDILLSTYNWETLRADEGFIFRLIGALRNQLVVEQGLVDLRDEAKALCETLGKVIDRSCNQP